MLHAALASFALLVANTQSATPAETADIAAITAQSRAFSQGFMDADLEAMMATYHEDAVIFPPGRAAISGESGIRAYWTPRPNRRVTHHAMNPDEIRIEDDLAYDHGVYTVSGETDGQAWGPSEGKYLVVWRRGADEVWRMQLDMWNDLD